MPESSPPDTSALRARLAADIAAGRTVSLAAEDLADPEVRRQLPQLLEQLTVKNDAPAYPVRIPGFTLLGEIGRGGMSTVYLARQDTLDRHVALKIAPKWLAGDKRLQQRLLQEARAMARVAHPNIIAIHDILEIDDTVAIAMDWIDGLTLANLLAALPGTPQPDDMPTIRQALGTPDGLPALAANAMRFFVRVVRDIALAVQHVHAAGLLHLDVKPSNILVRRDGRPLLADFGVVREIELAATHTRTFAGTPVYAAPEQLQRQDARFGPHTDVYGLGMTLYELLARVQPLRQLGLTRVVQDVLGGRIPPLASRIAIAPDLANIVHKAIAPETHHRYATAQQLADDLTAFLEHRPVIARPLTRAQRLRRWARNEPWKATLAAALLVLVPAVAGLGIYLQLQMPHIEQAQREQRRAEASDLKQRAYLKYFVTHTVGGEPSRHLQAAMALDPGPSTLASLLAMTHEEGLPETTDLLAANHDLVAAHQGLQLFAGKVAAGRSFFTADEVDALRNSTNQVDKYVLALDRVFRAEDAQYEEAYREAEQSLDEASMTANDDPLLFGLRLWVAARAGKPERHAAIVRAMRVRWSDDPRMMSWLFYSMEPIDRRAALAVAAELRQRDPGHPASWEMVVGEALRRPDVDAALANLDAAAAAGVQSEVLVMYRLLALAQRDGIAGAARALREIPPDLLTVSRRLRLLRTTDAAAAHQLRADLLRQETRSAQVLETLFRDARAEKHAEHTELAWTRWHELHPDRRGLYWERVGMLYGRKDHRAAGELMADVMLPLGAKTVLWRQACAVLVSAHHWATLARHAKRWEEVADATSRPEASFHVALAELRLGHSDAALPFLAVALTGSNVREQWYGHALIEDAWLRVHPGGPPAWRDPLIAQRRLVEFDAWVAGARGFPIGPWVHLVRAEVQFANGARDDAIATAEHGRHFRGAEPHAPEDWSAQLAAALERYRQP